MITVGEISAGIVVRFDPEALYEHGARTDRTAMERVHGVHYFVCTWRIRGMSIWSPAFSRWVPGRCRIEWKCGEFDWRVPNSFVDRTQMWLVPDCAIEPASLPHERTVRNGRNRASLSFLRGADDDESKAA